MDQFTKNKIEIIKNEIKNIQPLINETEKKLNNYKKDLNNLNINLIINENEYLKKLIDLLNINQQSFMPCNGSYYDNVISYNLTDPEINKNLILKEYFNVDRHEQYCKKYTINYSYRHTHNSLYDLIKNTSYLNNIKSEFTDEIYIIDILNKIQVELNFNLCSFDYSFSEINDSKIYLIDSNSLKFNEMFYDAEKLHLTKHCKLIYDSIEKFNFNILSYNNHKMIKFISSKSNNNYDLIKYLFNSAYCYECYLIISDSNIIPIPPIFEKINLLK